MKRNPDVGVLAPAVFAPDGAREFLCKRYPAVLDLLLRGFAPAFMRRLFCKRLDRYEMRDSIAAGAQVSPVPMMSGCFMLLRRKAVDATGGFDPQYFLYFEDFDWSVRLNRVTGSAYVPAVRVVHHGGGASRKGLRHVGDVHAERDALLQQARLEVGLSVRIDRQSPGDRRQRLHRPHALRAARGGGRRSRGGGAGRVGCG